MPSQSGESVLSRLDAGMPRKESSMSLSPSSEMLMPVAEHEAEMERMRQQVKAVSCRCTAQIEGGKIQRFWYAEYGKLRRAAEAVVDAPEGLRAVLESVTEDEIRAGRRMRL
jgi:hypothetical protein